MNLAVLLLTLAATAAPAPSPGRLQLDGQRRVRLDADWRFAKGEASGAEQPGFDDSSWRALDLPHDWAIEGPFAFANNPDTGGLPYFGVGWYRKRFELPASGRGRLYSVEFDGAMSNSTVYLNGHLLGGRPYGYIGFAVDLTPHLRFDGPNVLAVRLSPEPESSRWYPGAGLYRHVWLDVTGPVRVARWGTTIRTPLVTDASARVAVRTEVLNSRNAATTVVLETTVLDPAGKEVGRARSEPTAVAANGGAAVDQAIEVARPQRWDLDRPVLYRAVTVIQEGKAVLDRTETRFGIRTIEVDRANGFRLNGRPTRIRGVCNHHDLGALGTAVNRRALERQLQILKGMGVNAIRTSHNPPAPELLDLTDEMGLLVMDEAFDMWGQAKVKNGHGKYFAQWGDTDLRDMLRRDRNHPSVVLWSIGNEILEQADPAGAAVAKRLTAICHEEDPTRLVTAGLNQAENAIRNGLADAVDVPGFNYQVKNYERFQKEHPQWAILGSETASTVSSRGVYHLPIEKYETHPSLQITSYDVNAPSWAYIPDPEFEAQERLGLLGEFVWTGFDYLGEPTPFYDWRKPKTDKEWPARSSYFGIVDLAGFPKDRYYLYQSVWTKEPMVHVLPHWNWAGRDGQDIPVMVYTNCSEAELFLNGRSLGRKKRGAEPVELPVGQSVNDAKVYKSPYRLLWQVPYAPGTLEVVGLEGGKPVAKKTVRTAGAPARITLAPDRAKIAADGDDLSFVTVRVEDKDGNLCPEADNLVRFKVEGAGRIAAVDNGNAATTEPFQADYRKAFSGMALLIVRSQAGRQGAIEVTASGDGLASARTTLAAVAR